MAVGGFFAVMLGQSRTLVMNLKPGNYYAAASDFRYDIPKVMKAGKQL